MIAVSDLPLVNAVLNSLATILLLTGYVQIKRGHEQAHKRLMLSAFAMSVLFLACYVTYHLNTQVFRKFSGPPSLAYAYYTMLISHVVLAAIVPVLAIWTIWLGWRDRRAAHRRLARWTFPIWLYVSVTGVLIYLVLYQWFPS